MPKKIFQADNRSLKKSNLLLNLGPQHPASHGVLRLLLELDGETVERVEPHIGFLHRGTEKLIESRTYFQAIPYFDRLDYVSPMTQEHCFAMAIEKLLQCTVPPRAQYIRVMFCEIMRILNHLFNITTHAFDVGAITPMLWMFEEREKILSFCEAVSGARYHAAYIRPGGVASDVDDSLLEEIGKFCLQLPKKIDDMEGVLTENPIFKDRLINVGVVNAKQAISLGLTGPMLRSTGVGWDLRSDMPYEIYDQLLFEVPVGSNGDCYDRYSIRIKEMRESVKLVLQCINKMPRGPFAVDDPKIVPPTKESVNSSMESMIQHFKFFSDGYNVPIGETYTAVESPKGEFGIYLVSDGGKKPYRCHIRAPGFAHLQALDSTSRGGMLADLVCNMGAMDIILGEIDR